MEERRCKVYFIVKVSVGQKRVGESHVAPLAMSQHQGRGNVHRLLNPYYATKYDGKLHLDQIQHDTRQHDKVSFVGSLLVVRDDRHGTNLVIYRAVDKISSLGVLIFLPFCHRQPLGA